MGLDMSTLFLDCTRRGNVGDLTKAPEVFKRQALLASLPQLAKYRRTYTVAQITANLAKVAPEGTDYAMYQAAEWGDATELLISSSSGSHTQSSMTAVVGVLLGTRHH